MLYILMPLYFNFKSLLTFCEIHYKPANAAKIQARRLSRLMTAGTYSQIMMATVTKKKKEKQYLKSNKTNFFY